MSTHNLILWLREMLITLRTERGSRFLFIPTSAHLTELSRLLFLEYVSQEKADEYVLSLVCTDMQRRGILHGSAPFRYERYQFDHITFHDVYIRTSDNQQFCRGTSTDKMEAYAKAFGEVFERTALKFPPLPTDKYASCTRLRHAGEQFVAPSDFAQPTESQLKAFSDYRITDDDHFLWTRAECVRTGETVLIPTQSIFYGTLHRHREKTIVQQTTHGAGAAFNRAGAFRSGLFEIVHRHYFLRAWYRGEAFSYIDLNTIPQQSKLSQLVEDFCARGFAPRCIDLSREAGLPTVICMLERSGEIFCGGSTGTRMESAMQRAISEAFATYLWVQQSKLRGEYELTQESIDGVTDGFVDGELQAHRRVHLYGNSYFVAARAPFLTSGNADISFTTEFDVGDGFEVEVYALKHFENIYFHEVTSGTLSDYQYHAGRVVIPQSYFFALDERYSRPLLEDRVPPRRTLTNPFP